MDMDKVKDLYHQGIINKANYKKLAIEATLKILNSGQCKVVNVLGRGSFGSVVELENKQTKASLAAKIVFQDAVSKSEVEIWPKLSHANILPLFAHKHYVEVHTYLFVMPKCSASLSKMVQQLPFLLDPDALNRAISWIEGVLRGLSYLHGKSLCHLDLKTDNILIADNDTAVIADFGFTTTAERFTSGYGSPVIYRAPEARRVSGQAVAVDGPKYDIWTVGLLALETFTREGYYAEVCRWPTVSTTWTDQIYPTVLEMLQENNFLMLMSRAFPSTLFCESDARNIVSFIVSCLQLNPAGRPSVDELLQQKLFGGSRFTSLDDTDIWHKKASAFEIETLTNMYKQLDEYAKADGKFVEKIQLPKVSIERVEQSVASPQEKEVDPQVSDSVKVPSSNDRAYPEGKRQRFVEWTKMKKVTLARAFKTLVPNFRRSRK